MWHTSATNRPFKSGRGNPTKALVNTGKMAQEGLPPNHAEHTRGDPKHL